MQTSLHHKLIAISPQSSLPIHPLPIRTGDFELHARLRQFAADGHESAARDDVGPLGFHRPVGPPSAEPRPQESTQARAEQRLRLVGVFGED